MENTPKISQKEIIEAITSSGYLIEQRVASIISEKGFNVSLNDIYKDFETGKTREVDIHAFAIFPIKKEKYEDNVCYLYFECENNQQPVIFFKNSENENTPFLFEDIKITGSPIFIHPNSKMIDIGEFLKFDNFHHYCKNAIYTQYCTFTRTKNKEGKWIATHSTDQHDTFINLIKCIKYHMNHGIDYYHVGSEDFSGFKRLGLSFFLPIIILGGELFEAEVLDDKLVINEKNHIQFRKGIVHDREDLLPEMYQFDIVTEKYLPEYLDLIISENNITAARMAENYEILKKSADEIVEILNHDKSTKNLKMFVMKDTPKY